MKNYFTISIIIIILIFSTQSINAQEKLLKIETSNIRWFGEEITVVIS